MTKAELIGKIAESTGFDHATVSVVVEEFMSKTRESVASGSTLYLRGFGSFDPKLRRATIGRNITEGTTVPIPARKLPFFKPSPAFSRLMQK